MNTFAAALAHANNSPSLSETANGAATLSTSGSDLVNLFFTIGSSRARDISDQFHKAFAEDSVLATKMLFWARDVRGGAGEREIFRKLLKKLEIQAPLLAQKLVPLVPHYGRWDDLDAFDCAAVRHTAVAYWARAISEGNALASKWAPRQGALANQLRKQLRMDPKSYRKTVVANTKVVETQMCARDWSSINYSHVPSVAGARYQKAFNRRDPVRYAEFKAAALKGDVKINAGALFPYDVLKSIRCGDETAALAQWENLPNYLEDSGFILPVIDTSGSMTCAAGSSKSLTCLDVALSLGLYLADKQKGAFANMFLNFDTHSKIHQLQGNLLEKLNQISRCKWGGSTNIESAFKEILRVAVMGNVPPDQMPRYLLVITDMGFDPSSQNAGHTAMDMAREMYARHGYGLPVIVWWNVAHRLDGYGGDSNFPVASHTEGTALISGFSPSIVTSVLAAKEVTPWSIMMETLNQPRYQAVADAVTAGSVSPG